MVYSREILQGTECPKELRDNLDKLLIAVNKLREIWGKPMLVTSGLRSPEHNKLIGGAPSSAHLTAEACDFADPKEALDNYLDAHPEVLEKCGLFREHPSKTKGWVHLQTRPTKNRTFMP